MTYFVTTTQAILPSVQSCIWQAYVSTLTDKLSRPGGTKWQLSCKINDGSAVMDAILSDKVRAMAFLKDS